MRFKPLVRFAALLAAVALAIPAMAKPVSKHLTLSAPAKFGSTQLTAGDYHLLIDGTKVTVQRGRQIVAELEGRWEQREKKASANSVLLGAGGEVKEIRFAGDTRALVLSTP